MERLHRCFKRDAGKNLQKIEDVAKGHGATVLNYGNREYDDYFLFDVMHVGVKGWMEVEKELYKFANQAN